MAEAEGFGDEEEKEWVDPKTFKPDLYIAAMLNDTEKVIDYLSQQVPPTHIDTSNNWTVIVFSLVVSFYGKNIYLLIVLIVYFLAIALGR